MDAEKNLIHNQIENLNLPSQGLAQNLIQLISLKDKITAEHSYRVFAITKEWTEAMASRSKWTDLDIQSLALSAYLHDVGKVGIVNDILLKEGALTAEEWSVLSQHPQIGYELVKNDPAYSSVADGIRFHHERWDGAGYPLGLKGSEIPVIAQIISVVDTYDAITSNRSYRAARTHAEALEIIGNEAGRQFNPEIASEFVQFMHARNT